MTPPRGRLEWPSLASDERGVWETGEDRDGSRPGSTGPSAAWRWESLASSVAAVVEVAASTLSDDEVRAELQAVETAKRALEARSCRLTSALTSRAAAEARAASPEDPRVGERAARQVRAELVDGLRLSPSAVLGAQRIGDRVDASPLVAAALDAGVITADHVRAIDTTLQHLSGEERRTTEAQLVEVATTGTPRDVHDAGVRLLCVLDHDAAVDAEQRRHHRRQVHVVRDRDGTVWLKGGVAGLQGEMLMTAFHAFRRPDRPGEYRTPGQRGADALYDLCRAAVGDPETPGDDTVAEKPKRQHGVQPHLSVTIDFNTLLTGEGVAETDWSGPLPWGAVRDQLAGADLTFIAVRDEVPVAVTTKTRYVPVGLWKGAKLRDGGCIRVHCDAPAAWTEVAHLAEWFTDGGKLTLDTAGLLCKYDHRAFDAGRLAVTWINGRPIVHPHDQPPDPPPSAPPGDPP